MIAGTRARWVRYGVDDNPHSTTYREKVRIEESGKIIAFERAGSPATWSVLVLSDAGELQTPTLDAIRFAPDETAESRNAADAALAQIEYLEEFLRENFPDTDSEGYVADRVARALARSSAAASEARLEVISLAAARDEALTQHAAAVAEAVAHAPTFAAGEREAMQAELAKIKTERDAIAEQCKRLQAAAKTAAKKEKKGEQGPQATSEKP